MTPPTIAPQYMFGAGQFWFVPNAGNLTTTPTPLRLATLQEVSLEFGAEMKELYGENQYPETVAIGKRKVSGKAKIGRWNTTAMNQLMFSGSQSVGMDLVNVNESGTIPAMSTFTIQVTDHTTFVEDLGVTYANGTPFINIGSASLSAVGQYKVDASTGTYTFFSGDASAPVKITYTKASASVGTTLIIDNQIMGYGPVFQCVFRAAFRNQECNIVLQACIAGKISLQSKVDDFTTPEIDFSAFQDATGRVGYIYSTQ
jgi:hypothetical protein